MASSIPTVSEEAGDSASKGTANAADIDDFFDSLLAEPSSDEPSQQPDTDMPGEVTAESCIAVEAPGDPDRASVTANVGAGDSGEGSAVSSSSHTAAEAATVAPQQHTHIESSVLATTSAPSVKMALTRPGVGADEVTPEDSPKNDEEARLRDALTLFYRERKSGDKLGNVARIARRYAGEGLVDLWAMVATKYTLPPATAVQWLARTLGPGAAVQWPRGHAPEAALRTLVNSTAPGASVEAAVFMALEAGDVDAVGALAFYGCPDTAMRPRIWRALLGWLPPKAAVAADSSHAHGRESQEAAALQERRVAYRELRARLDADAAATAVVGEERLVEASGSPSPADIVVPADAASWKERARLREEVETDARAAWRGEMFTSRTDIAEAVASIVLIHARRSRSYVRGSCDLAALLLFVFAHEGSAEGTELGDAEADAFWCLSQLMAEVQDSIADDTSLTAQVNRVFGLLRAYDPPLAQLLMSSGLGALPAQRFGSALCTRAGFPLSVCARLWDGLLADPRRFQFCDYIVIAALLLGREELLQRTDVGGIAEVLIEVPRLADADLLLRTACAVCAFERHGRFPPKPPPGTDTLDIGRRGVSSGAHEVVAAAQTQLSTFWGKALEVGRTATRGAVAQAEELVKVERAIQLRTSAAQAAAHVSSAATAAGSAASAALDKAVEAAPPAAVEEKAPRIEGDEAEPKNTATGEVAGDTGTDTATGGVVGSTEDGMLALGASSAGPELGTALSSGGATAAGLSDKLAALEDKLEALVSETPSQTGDEDAAVSPVSPPKPTADDGDGGSVIPQLEEVPQLAEVPLLAEVPQPAEVPQLAGVPQVMVAPQLAEGGEAARDIEAEAVPQLVELAASHEALPQLVVQVDSAGTAGGSARRRAPCSQD